MNPLTESHIKEIFADEKESPFVPRLDHVDWAVLDYFGWIHPGGHSGYVVAPLANDDDLRGMLLRRAVTTATRPRMEMCSWCNHVHKRNGTAMFSVVVKGTDERRTIGNRMCRNLDCSLRIRNLCSDPPSYMMETLDLQNKVMRLQNSIYRFLYRANALYTT
ncbi:MAG: hypothetical protein ACJAYE_000652 [Candidatus Azotimanducaceae bacterium]|jgi:hypothetical protein